MSLPAPRYQIFGDTILDTHLIRQGWINSSPEEQKTAIVYTRRPRDYSLGYNNGYGESFKQLYGFLDHFNRNAIDGTYISIKNKS